MIVCNSIAELQQQRAYWRQRGNSVGFVPTMGNLHQGHMALITQAQSQCDKVVVSIFVNPTQFSADEDFAHYPRTEKQDQTLITPYCDLLFYPQVQTIYSKGHCPTQIDIPTHTRLLCGTTRPKHFTGVLTVVNLLFNVVQPDVAYFGLKDYQQFWLVQRMVYDLHIPIRLVGVDTGRHSDGLAISSRNQYLTPDQRQTASLLYQTLCQTALALEAQLPLSATSADRIQSLCLQASDRLNQAGFQVEYISLLDSHTLQPPTDQSTDCRLFAAAWLGKARLIDNLAISNTAS